ncbi:MAG: LUD domain-containing protein [Peptococcaceae bacterium]|jgi:iron-sulfur cluster protein|nr:LUD domain-containing protein [Peptococcaceae bacterium]MDH7524367.1 LUD domain-containing protein [Peptococcaceae bacterium]
MLNKFYLLLGAKQRRERRRAAALRWFKRLLEAAEREGEGVLSRFELKERIREGLNDASSRLTRQKALGVIRMSVRQMTASCPGLKERLRGIKEYSIANLPVLMEQAVVSLKENGCRVFIAGTDEEAVSYIGEIVGNKLVVKSKSNAGKEIEIADRLERLGARVIETDLGDRINQMAGSGASHPLAPAIHLPVEKVAELFSKETGRKLEGDVETLVRAARASLRGYLEEAGVGLSGANAVVAETGSIILAENEGNIRAVTGMPEIHIAVTGVEKIVPSLDDGLAVARAAAVCGTGQDMGTYVSIISGPTRYNGRDNSFQGAGQGPAEVHVVFLAAGRDRAIKEGFAEALYCINCGGCLNFCPVYAEIGDKFGYKHLGGRGAVFTAFHESLEKAEEAGLSFCLGCQKCLESCAAGINTPEMILRLRAEAVDKRRPVQGYNKVATAVLVENRLSRWLKPARVLQDAAVKRQAGGDFAVPRIGLPGLGIPATRLVPTIAGRFFEEMISGRPAVDKYKVKVNFFVGCVTRYVLPRLGADLLDVLETQAVKVVVQEKEACCGLPLLAAGYREEATALARCNVKLFAQECADFMVFVCPACAAAVKKEWPRLLENEGDELKEKSLELAAKVMDISQFLLEVVGLEMFRKTVEKRVTYHDPCHLAGGLGVREQPRSLLRAIGGLDLVEMKEADSCCGFGGGFSFAYYELASRIGSKKAEKIGDTGASHVVTGCPGCMIHLADSLHQAGGGQKVVHTIELAAMAVRGGRN